jgi:hypothetical protein
MDGIKEFGCWVNGGAWTTVEGRAILMYYRLGKFEDVYRSAIRAMKWAKDFRMDQPFTQRGENTANNWYDEGQWLHGDGVAVMADNFAIPAATIRGLFDYEYKADRLILRPRIPGSVTRYIQHEPVRFGSKKIWLSCRNGGPKVRSWSINGKPAGKGPANELVLEYDKLPDEARVEIITEGGWEKMELSSPYPEVPALTALKPDIEFSAENLPDSMQKPFLVLTRMEKELSKNPSAATDQAFAREALTSFHAYQERIVIDPGPGYYRAIDQKRKENIIKLYARTAMALYRGFEKRMEKQGQR